MIITKTPRKEKWSFTHVFRDGKMIKMHSTSSATSFELVPGDMLVYTKTVYGQTQKFYLVVAAEGDNIFTMCVPVC